MALYGVCRSMYTGYNVGSSVQFLNGESWINSFYGEVFASDAYYYLWQDFGPEIMNGSGLTVSNYWFPQMIWMYPYNLINQTNKILQYIDGAEGEIKKRDFIKAQALTIRAHAYTKLMQYFGPRYEDDVQGNLEVCPLRLEPGTGNIANSTTAEVTAQIYKDLDDAIALYKSSGLKRTENYEPSLEVAQGIYARIAMVRHDWAKAREMAAAARADHPIMSSDEYLAGFNKPNKEWIWNNYNDLNDMYVGYFSWGALFACNGAYVSNWGYGAGAINYDLYRKMDPKDIRRKLFFTPDKPLTIGLRPAHFWNSNYVEEASMSVNIKDNAGNPTALANVVRMYSNMMMPADGISYFQRQAYRSSDNENDYLEGVVPFGAQYKFWGAGAFSNSSVPFMRASELAFLEAEAAYMLGDETAARKILEEINNNRITGGYSCTASGLDLLEEIRLNKRIELWGEGFCWTDLKRWNMYMIRNPWIEGDPNSNNIPALFKCNIAPTELNNWRVAIPDTETDYNELIDKFKH